MSRSDLRLPFALGLLVTVSAFAGAQLPHGTIERRLELRQVSADTLVHDYAGMGYFLSFPPDTTLTRSSVELPTGEIRTLTRGGGSFFLGSYLGDAAQAGAMYPAGGYTLRSYAGDDLAYEFSAPLTPEFSYAMAPKILNFDEIRMVQPGQSLTVRVGGFTPFAGATNNFISYTFREYVNGAYVRDISQGSAVGGPDGASFTLDGSAFVIGHEYRIGTLSQSNSYYPFGSAGVTGGTASLFSNASNFMTFTPVPEPATMAALGLGALALLRRRRLATRG